MFTSGRIAQAEMGEWSRSRAFASESSHSLSQAIQAKMGSRIQARQEKETKEIAEEKGGSEPGERVRPRNTN